ncbi:hypothetical protein HDZ31DRAFT_74872 [Schizophyllum fasciatum]
MDAGYEIAASPDLSLDVQLGVSDIPAIYSFFEAIYGIACGQSIKKQVIKEKAILETTKELFNTHSASMPPEDRKKCQQLIDQYVPVLSNLQELSSRRMTQDTDDVEKLLVSFASRWSPAHIRHARAITEKCRENEHFCRTRTEKARQIEALQALLRASGDLEAANITAAAAETTLAQVNDPRWASFLRPLARHALARLRSPILDPANRAFTKSPLLVTITARRLTEYEEANGCDHWERRASVLLCERQLSSKHLKHPMAGSGLDHVRIADDLANLNLRNSGDNKYHLIKGQDALTSDQVANMIGAAVVERQDGMIVHPADGPPVYQVLLPWSLECQI